MVTMVMMMVNKNEKKRTVEYVLVRRFESFVPPIDEMIKFSQIDCIFAIQSSVSIKSFP